MADIAPYCGGYCALLRLILHLIAADMADLHLIVADIAPYCGGYCGLLRQILDLRAADIAPYCSGYCALLHLLERVLRVLAADIA